MDDKVHTILAIPNIIIKINFNKSRWWKFLIYEKNFLDCCTYSMKILENHKINKKASSIEENVLQKIEHY